MNHERLVDALGEAVERSTVQGVEVISTPCESLVDEEEVTLVEVTFAGAMRARVIDLDRIRACLASLVEGGAPGIDLFGPPDSFVSFVGKVGGRAFSLRIRAT
jgi:hypothetical protein